MPETWDAPGHLHETGGTEPTEAFEELCGPTNSTQSTGGGAVAEVLTGEYFAHLADLDPDDELRSVAGLDKATVKEIRSFHRKFSLPQPVTLRDVPVMRVAWVDSYLEEAPARLEVAEDAAEQGHDDPHDTLETLKRARAERFQERERERAERTAAKAAGVDGFAGLVLSVSALSALPPPTPLVDGFLFQGTLAQLAGNPGDGKTFAALGMACAVASGRSWNGHRVPTATPVVYVAGEGSTGLFARIAAWCGLHGLSPAELDGKLHILARPVQLGSAEDMRQLAKLIRDTGAGLVVLDTRARCTVGLEENSATEQGLAVAAVEAVIAATGATVMVVHHLGAGQQRGRGSTAWDGAVYSDLVLGRNKDGEVIIACSKHKDAPDGCKHLFRLEPVTVPQDVMPDAEERRRTSLVLVNVDPMEDRGGETAEAILKLIANTAGPDGLTRAKIAEFADKEDICKKTTTYQSVNTLFYTGKLMNVGTQKVPRYVVAPEARGAS